jgi:DNA replication and repair protein RecF
MKLLDISLRNFRNLADINVNFEKPITVLVGDNAQGKTNFLESVFFLATGKPIKSETEEEIIKFSQPSVSVKGRVINTGGEETEITANIHSTEFGLRKKFLVNGIPRRLLDYSGNLVAVFFRPEDIYLVTGSPGARRDYIDQTIGQVDRDYRKNISSYQKIIIRKNRLLKLIREGLAGKDELLYWNSQQLNLGMDLQRRRTEFFKSINSYEKKFGDFEYQYFPSLISQERQNELYEREIQAVASLAGPHRDDFKFFFEDKDLAKYGSRGEQRTAVLDLKIMEISFFEEILNDRPILLLDDIFSELDENHRKHVIELSRLQQTLIATVEYDEYLKSVLEKEQVLRVESGVIGF